MTNKPNFFYSASVMGYGQGRKWHGLYDFPDFPRVTKTLTFHTRYGYPLAVMRVGNTVWNRVSLHNIGFYGWLKRYGDKDLSNITVSIAGDSFELSSMMYELGYTNINGVELNFSCPNAKEYNYYGWVPSTGYGKYLIYLKLNYKQDPYKFNLDNVHGIRLNSVPWVVGGLSGKAAKQKNWGFIEQFGRELNVAGCSFKNMDDIKRLIDMGCKEIGIGSVILTDPKFVEKLGEL